MPEQIREVSPPKGISRFLYRLPICMYRIGLGRLMGSRFLLLEHVGRRSGKLRQNVLEVVRWDKAAGTVYVVSAWGDKSDWLRNLRAHPAVTINVAGTRYSANAIPLARDESERELLDYAQRYPRAAKELSRLLGYRLDGTPEDFAALADQMTIVELHYDEE
jgi:deazaflavin-dependent oxidoreductase (nitroreductase family)